MFTNTHEKMAPLALMLCMLLLSLDVAAATAREVMQMANHRAYYSGGDKTSTDHVVVKSRNGTVRTRSAHMIRLDDRPGGNQSYLVYFSAPTDLEQTTFLVHKYPGRADNRWLYLPKLDIVRRIQAGDKRTHFVGTDLFYEDVSGRHLDADNHTLLEESAQYWIIRSEPKASHEVEFAWYKTWVHKQTQLAMQIMYHDTNDKVYRRFQVKKVRNVDGIPTPTLTILQDLNTGSTTTVNTLEIDYGRGLEKRLFSEQSLRQPPLNQLNLK